MVVTFEVPGHSRKHIFFQDAEREIPAYAQLRQACEQGAFDVLWCRARDRLGRTDALIAQVEALVTNAGAEVYSAALPHQLGQSNEASAIYLSAIERAAAQTENVTRNRRREMGMKARVRRGLPASRLDLRLSPRAQRPRQDHRRRVRPRDRGRVPGHPSLPGGQELQRHR